MDEKDDAGSGAEESMDDIDDEELRRMVEDAMKPPDEEALEHIEAESEPEEEDEAPELGPESSNKVEFRELGRAEDSRQPDIPSLFECAGLIISRACLISAGSTPLVPFADFNPAEIARAELLAGRPLRSVLRGDTEWKWHNFAYFPRGFLESDEATDRLHEIK